jgi:AraC-like DNA-binding protein
MKIKLEDLGLRKDEVARYRSFSGDMFNCPLHYHDCFELTYLKSSSGTLLVGNETYQYHAGQLFLFAPGVAHSFVHDESKLALGQKPEGCVLLINENFLKNSYIDWQESFLLNTLLENSKCGIAFSMSDCKRTNLMYKRFATLDITGFEMLKSVSTIVFELAEAKRFTLLQHTKELIPLETNIQSPISLATFYIHNHFHKEMTVEEVAKYVNMSYSSFSRYFKQKMKMNFTSYLQKIRLAHAKKLLIESNLTVSQICYESGFNNPPFFNRVFKQSQNCSPREYRIKHQ